MKQLDENLWVENYPLTVLGTTHGRTVTIIRLQSGRLVVHSMGPFSSNDSGQIRALGEPSWLVEAMLLHDTFAQQGRETFPGVPFLGPEGFAEVVNFPILPLLPAPAEWTGELEVLAVAGAPRLKEHVFLHIPSRTLIVADLVFNFPRDESGWDRFFHRYVAGIKRYPGLSRIFRLCIKDRSAFRTSMSAILSANFDRIIVGHGRVIERDGKALLSRALADVGLE
ncbi:MAG TPA: hypothetical protein VIT23_05585 [Terrimicrobiaceae bacterium]